MTTTDQARERLAQQQGKGTEVAKVDPQKQVLAQLNDAVTKVLPRTIDATRFNRILASTLNRNPDLLKADRASLFGAVITAAQCGLEPGTHEGHCWIVGPFRDKGEQVAVFMLGYKGLVELALRSGRVASIIARPVYEGEPFSYREELEHTILRHEPALDGMPDVNKLRGCYAIARLSDKEAVPLSVYLSRDQIESYRARSKSPDGPGWRDDYVAMALKTATKRLEPWLPKSPELRTAVIADEQVAHWDGGGVKVEPEADDGEAIEVVTTVREEPDGTPDGTPDDDTPHEPPDDIGSMRKAQLVKRLRAAGLDHDGKVEELRERWRAHVQGSSAASPSAGESGEGDPTPSPDADQGEDDTPRRDAEPAPEPEPAPHEGGEASDARGPSPRAAGSTSARGTQPPPPDEHPQQGEGATTDPPDGETPEGDGPEPPPPPDETVAEHAKRLDVKTVPLLNELKRVWPRNSTWDMPSNTKQIDEAAEDPDKAAIIHRAIDRLGGEGE